MTSPASTPQTALRWLLAKGYGKENPQGWVRIVAAPTPVPVDKPQKRGVVRDNTQGGKAQANEARNKAQMRAQAAQDLQSFVAVIRCLSDATQVECTQGSTKEELLFRLRPPKEVFADPRARAAASFIKEACWKREDDDLTLGGEIMVEWWEGVIEGEEAEGYRARGVAGLFETEEDAVLAYRDAP